ncbi:Aste57867_2526 [Aphanomyces stellatus]|uniref:Aste57867_2526 protein n=1 Tax=Aphanomyces stellatus TaxID=120398 RepID=A0A485KCY0_9STRA|nr:hypothetical protein As57867_002519 [Aphanomyces stellatus]VFT79725.1 Aste57867_2526 [Aphanomyces stellatus]
MITHPRLLLENNKHVGHSRIQGHVCPTFRRHSTLTHQDQSVRPIRFSSTFIGRGAPPPSPSVKCPLDRTPLAHVTDVLSTLPHLTHLTLRSCLQDNPAPWARLLQVLPTSNITSLAMQSPSTHAKLTLTSAMAESVIQWLETRPVTRLTMDYWDFAAATPAWEMRFYAALAAASTLTSLRLVEPTLERMVFSLVATSVVTHLVHFELDLKEANPSILGSVLNGLLHLQSLTVRDRSHSVAWGSRLHQVIAPALVTLQLFGVAIGDASMHLFGTALARSNSTEFVAAFAAAGISSVFLVHVAPYLGRTITLNTLTITYLEAEQKGARLYATLDAQLDQSTRRTLFAHMLANPVLKACKLARLNIADYSAKDLARALRRNVSLSRLDLSHNEMTPNGVHAIVYAVQARRLPSLELNFSNQHDRFANTNDEPLLHVEGHGVEIYCATSNGAYARPRRSYLHRFRSAELS